MTASDHPVLVIDDDPDIRWTVAELLEDWGYTVTTAVHGRDALDKLEAGVRPCLILLDLTMPVMNGYEFRQAQRADPAFAEIPTIVLSAAGNLAERAKELAVDNVLRKPIALEQLSSIAERFCAPAKVHN
jgi:CheY-like chemotaxis protein